MRHLALCLLTLFAAPLAAQNLDFSVSAGTTGVGLDFSSKITDWIDVRAGVSFVPHFEYNMNFGVEVAGEDATPEENQSRFEKLAKKLYDLTSIEVDDHVKMVGTPKFFNYKLLVDVHPFKNDRRWFVTAGFYVGSSTIAKAENDLSEVQTLLGVNMYNKMYQKSINDEPVFTLNNTPIYMEQFAEYGEMGMNVGTYADGTPYFMKPDANSTVSARLKVNKFRPYLGCGFGDKLGNASRFSYNVDCGALFWGGTPKVVTHEGVDLAKLATVKGRPGDYVDLVKKFKVYPVLSVRISYNLF